MASSRISWGILGTSHISEVMAEAIRESSTSKLTAVASRSTEKAQSFANEYNIAKHHGNFDALLADPEIDAIYIGLPNHLHKDWIIKCAKAGKHILCEKPLVMNVQEAREAYDAVKTANVFCMEGLMYLCHPLIAKLREIVTQRVIGDIKLINATYFANIAAKANPISSSAILNLGCYPLSLIRLLVGIALGAPVVDPNEMISRGRMTGKNHDSQASTIMKFEKQIMAVINTADDLEMYSHFEIHGTQGYIRLMTNPWMPSRDNNRILIHLNDEATPYEVRVTAEKSLYTYQIDAVNHNILSGNFDDSRSGVTWQNSIGNVAILDAWLKQVRSHVASTI